MSSISHYGYVILSIDGRNRKEHIVIAEKALGKSLPPGAEVHHHNEIRTDNRNENLVICEDHRYHMLLHARMKILKAGGDPDAPVAAYIKQVPDQKARTDARLTATQVLAIRAMAAAGTPQRRIGEHFGIGQGTVHKIVTRKRWAHV